MNPSSLTSSGIQIEAAKFPPAVKPPGLDKTLFLSGAGTYITLYFIYVSGRV